MAITPEQGASVYKSTGSIGRVFKALRYSVQGLRAALRYEAAFRQEASLAIVMIPAAFFLGRHALEVFLLIAAVILVLIVELLNSAIEALADAITTASHPLIGRAKDLGSAAVLLALLLAGGAWATVTWLRFTS
jgi:diacylglycerol kinase (ATP)